MITLHKTLLFSAAFLMATATHAQQQRGYPNRGGNGFLNIINNIANNDKHVQSNELNNAPDNVEVQQFQLNDINVDNVSNYNQVLVDNISFNNGNNFNNTSEVNRGSSGNSNPVNINPIQSQAIFNLNNKTPRIDNTAFQVQSRGNIARLNNPVNRNVSRGNSSRQRVQVTRESNPQRQVPVRQIQREEQVQVAQVKQVKEEKPARVKTARIKNDPIANIRINPMKIPGYREKMKEEKEKTARVAGISSSGKKYYASGTTKKVKTRNSVKLQKNFMKKKIWNPTKKWFQKHFRGGIKFKVKNCCYFKG